ncbi:hypothetical protein [Enterobacter kobei]|uniref:hypothetical protein n=1 Tax=Enterobacter kobei TaxID=208224 RepID=UPI00403F13BD
MSTITKEFTKEQLQQIEAAAKEVIWPVVWSEKKAREHFSEKITPKVVLKLARIALASLETEAVAWRSLYYENHGLLTGSKNVLASWQKQGWECEPLYSAPPAPVSDEDLLHMAASAIDDLLSNKDRSGAGVWADIPAKLRRAAMLQGADGNSPVIPDGWVMVPVELTGAMTNAMTDAILDDLHNVDVWRSVLAAAPQPEVK